MISAINRFFNQLGQQKANDEPLPEEQIHQLTAVMMAEVMMSDGGISAVEQSEICQILESAFHLSLEDINEIITIAENKTDNATSLFEFTHKVNLYFSPEQKATLIEHMWQVAFADDNLDKFEEATIRKVAELIHVPHSVFIQTKLRARPV